VAKTLALPHAPNLDADPLNGSHDFVEAFGRDKAAVVWRTVSKLIQLPLDLQSQHLLVRLSMVNSTTYRLRAGPIDKDAGCMDNSGRDAARCIANASADMEGPLLSPTAAEQIGLPLRLGRCRLHVPTLALAGTALLSSGALTQAALQDAPAFLSHFDGPHRGSMQRMRHNKEI
jgi:hypothetical protein